MTTYSIKLDDLDLALLPVPSLSYNHVLKKEHFDFQLLIKEETEDPTVTHPCHICAIDVPKAFWTEHCAGAKHRANARIATEATRRTSALITATPPPKTPLTTEKFCDSCTCIAGKDHEKTKAHKLSVTQDRMLYNLVMIYTGEDVSDDQREKENKTDSKYAKKDKDKEVDLNVIRREVNHLSNIGNDEGPTTNTLYEEDIADIDLNIVKLNVDPFSELEEEKGTTKIANENIQQNTDEKNMDGEVESIPSYNTQLSTFEDGMSNAILLPDEDEFQKTARTIPEDNGEIKVKKTRTRRRKNKSKLASETNITTEDPIVYEDASDRELNVPDPNDKGLDVKDAFVSYYPLVDESAIHYPFIKDMLHVRCLICDCIVPRTVYNRVTHLKGRPHAANAKKQLHIVKDAFILAKKQINDIK